MRSCSSSIPYPQRYACFSPSKYTTSNTVVSNSKYQKNASPTNSSTRAKDPSLFQESLMQPQKIYKQNSTTSEPPHNEAKDGPLIPYRICTYNTNPINKSLSSLNYQLWGSPPNWFPREDNKGRCPQPTIKILNLKVPTCPQLPAHPVSNLTGGNMGQQDVSKSHHCIQFPIIQSSMKLHIPTPLLLLMMPHR